MINKDILANGITVLTMKMPYAYSVSTGIWSRTGSAWEENRISGVSHFLEHMLFKGTPTRSAAQITDCMEWVGGQLNAFTSKEYTCYYAKTLSENFALSMDVLSDMYLHPLLDGGEFDKEKNVILEEINMYEDDPDDLSHDLFAATIWKEHPYGRSIAGTKNTVGSLQRDELFDYWKKYYQPQRTIVSVCGNVERQQVLDEVERYFGNFQNLARIETLPDLKTYKGNSYIHKDIEQMHLCVGVPAIKEDDPDWTASVIMNNAFGGSMSSRLFQEAREKKGLTYSIYSSLSAYSMGGYLSAYAATSHKYLKDVVRIILEQLYDILDKGLSDEELEKSKQQIKGSLLLNLESTSTVMQKLAKYEMIYGRVITTEETLERLMRVTHEDIRRACKRIFIKNNLLMSLVGAKEADFDLNDML